MNPFRYGQVVSNKFYCNRPQLENKLRSRLLSGQNTCIIGERRTGKTSLIVHTAEHTKSKRTVYIDLMEVKTVEDIHKRVLNGIVKAGGGGDLFHKLLKSVSALRPTLSIDPVTSVPVVSIDSALQLNPQSIEGLLDLFSGRDFKNFVVVMDEFQDIKNIADSAQLLAIMRGKIQFMQDIPFVFCGSIRSEMNLIFSDPQSPFFKSALPIEVGTVDRDAFTAFIKKKFIEGKMRISDPLINRIFELTGENPGDTQQLCSAIYDVGEINKQVSEITLQEALGYLFAQESKCYEAHLSRLTGIQLKCLTAVAKAGGKNTTSRDFIKTSGIAQPASIRKALLRLEQLKILFLQNGEYKFVNPFFARWLVHKGF